MSNDEVGLRIEVRSPTICPPTDSGYRSIFLEEGWAHHKYFGWEEMESRPGLRWLRKRHYFFSRDLMLLTRGGEDRLGGVLAANRASVRFGDVTIHDFDSVLGRPPEFGDWHFRQSQQGERLLNVATFVIDLSQDEESILHGFNADYRRKVKRAPSLGVTAEAHERPSSQLLASFVGGFNMFARTRGLKPLDPKTAQRMYAGDDAVLFIAKRCGQICSYLHVYKTEKSGIFMYGFTPFRDNHGAGQFLQWSAIRRLKELGLRWYDLGGVAGKDAQDGIYNFKAKFGGRFVDLGCEWRGEGVLAGAAHRMRDAMQR